MIEPVYPVRPDGKLPGRDPAHGREMEILCASDERYLPHVATMLCSLLEHNSNLRVHFFYSSITSTELAELRSLVTRYQSKITFYEIAPADFEDLRVDKWASMAVYYRLLAPRRLPPEVDKVLYLDSDIIVRSPLSSLWDIDVAGHALAAASTYYEDDAKKALGLPADTKCFNSGVMLINLRFWRQNKVPEKAISFARNNPEAVQYWDQDALNAVLAGKWVELASCWNWREWRRSPVGAEMEPAIVHFWTADKPWRWSNNHPFKDDYQRYRRKTPWRRYKQEGQPGLLQRLAHSPRQLARMVLPTGLRRWLRLRVMDSGP
jgi:lipopolysaccharide biosynthesis glycosyltransferase